MHPTDSVLLGAAGLAPGNPARAARPWGEAQGRQQRGVIPPWPRWKPLGTPTHREGSEAPDPIGLQEPGPTSPADRFTPPPRPPPPPHECRTKLMGPETTLSAL